MPRPKQAQRLRMAQLGLCQGRYTITQHGAAPIKAALGYRLRHSGTEGAEGFHRQLRVLPLILLFSKPSVKVVFNSAGKADGLSNWQNPSLFASAVY
jgi:hypothetical protein